MRLSIAIDGPAGAGKSTIAKMLAERFELMYINTGSMYRAVALFADRKGIKYTDTEVLCSMVDDMDMHFDGDALYANGEDVSYDIRLPYISSIVSNYATVPEVRSTLVKLQRKISDKYGVVMDGRDIGTVVLKNADYKFFLTATPEKRATRRYLELTQKGTIVNYDMILEEINKRDYIDSHREINPLTRANDAIMIDSSTMEIIDVVNEMSNIIKNKINLK